MGFRNPIVVADEIVSGSFAGSYTIDGSFTIGNPATSHVVIGSDTHGANGVRLYGNDGVTPLIDLSIGSPSVAGSVVSGAVANATNAVSATTATTASTASSVPAAGITAGTVAGGVTVPGGNVSGAVASATTASTASSVPAAGITAGTVAGGVTVPGGNVSGTVASATTATSATSATTATNLAGGGTAAGSTAITGSLVVGNAATSHVVVGTDAHGANGVRLYGSNGVTPLIDLTISGTPTISGALIETALSGQRMAMTVSGGTGFLFGYTGHGTETQPGYVSTSTQVAPNGGTILTTALSSPDNATGDPATVNLGSGSSAGTGGAGNGSSVVLSADIIGLAGGAVGNQTQWDGTTLNVGGVVSASGGAATHILATSPGYGGDAASFRNLSGAAAISVGDGTRWSWHGTATSAGDWATGTGVGDMVLRSTSNRVFVVGALVASGTLNAGASTVGTLTTTGVHTYNSIGTRSTSVTGGSAQALPSAPVGYMGITINGTSRVIPYYS